MKRIALILTLVLCFSCLSGCGFLEDYLRFVSREAEQMLEEPLEPPMEMEQPPEIGTPEPEPETAVTNEGTGLAPHEKPWSEEESETAPVSPTPVSPTPVSPTPVTPQPQQPTAVTPTQPTGTDVAAQVEQIRAWYQAIVFDTNLEAHTFGDAATVYLQNGQIVSVAEYQQIRDAVNPATVTIHYYYRNGVPFFVFFEYENYSEYDEVRLYFADGQLIRWIIDQNAPNDNVPNDMWQAYYGAANTVYRNAQEALGY